MERTSKTRVLTANDVMMSNARAQATIKWLQNLGVLNGHDAKQSVAGVEYMTRELLLTLTEDDDG